MRGSQGIIQGLRRSVSEKIAWRNWNAREKRRIRHLREMGTGLRRMQECDNLEMSHSLMELRYLAHIVEKDVILFEKPVFSRTAESLSQRLLKHASLFPELNPVVEWAKRIELAYDSRDRGAIVQKATPAPAKGSFESVRDLVRRRRSVRTFLSDKPDFSSLVNLIEEAAWSPSSCNRQPVKSFVCGNGEAKTLLEAHMRGGKGFLASSPYVIVLCADLRSYRYPSEANLPYLDVGMYAQTLLLLLESAGLASCLVSWSMSERSEDEVRAKLGIARHLLPVVAICTGYRAYTPLPSPRKSREEIWSTGNSCGD